MKTHKQSSQDTVNRFWATTFVVLSSDTSIVSYIGFIIKQPQAVVAKIINLIGLILYRYNLQDMFGHQMIQLQMDFLHLVLVQLYL